MKNVLEISRFFCCCNCARMGEVSDGQTYSQWTFRPLEDSSNGKTKHAGTICVRSGYAHCKSSDRARANARSGSDCTSRRPMVTIGNGLRDHPDPHPPIPDGPSPPSLGWPISSSCVADSLESR